MATSNMKKCVLILLLFIAVLANISVGEQPKKITEECKKRCERSYPPHTYPKTETHEACLRGCRLSAIGQLSSSNRNKENVSNICIAGCKESYPEQDRLFACKFGCNSQDIIPTADTLYKEQKDAVGIMSMHGYMSLRPIMIAQQYCHGLIRKVTYYVSISTAYYSRTNSAGQTVVVKINGPPQFFASVSQQRQDDTQLKVQKKEKGDNGYTWKVVHKSKAWLHCVSQRSGLPFWLLSSILFMGFAFMLWLCCSSISLDQKQEKEKQLLVDDIFLLEDDDEFLLKKQPLTKSEEAGPLPVKVNISATTI